MRDVSETTFPLFEHQIAGHGDIRYDPESGHILKRYRGNELEAYQAILKNPQVAKWFPEFHGTRSHVDKSDSTFLVLSDLTCGMTAPRLMDIKLGRQQHTPFMPEEKQEKQRKKCAGTTSSEYGFRLCGVQFNDARRTKSVYQLDKRTARKFDLQRQQEEIANFFQVDDARGHILLEKLQDQLESLILDLSDVANEDDDTACSRPQRLHFFSTSLFVAYDGAYFESPAENAINGVDTDSSDDARPSSRLVVRIIDLGQVYTQEEMERAGHGREKSGFLDGLRNIRNLVCDIVSAGV